MKQRFNHFSKSTLSVILAVCMLLSCLTAGIVATNAAKMWSESVGYSAMGTILYDNSLTNWSKVYCFVLKSNYAIAYEMTPTKNPTVLSYTNSGWTDRSQFFFAPTATDAAKGGTNSNSRGELTGGSVYTDKINCSDYDANHTFFPASSSGGALTKTFTKVIASGAYDTKLQINPDISNVSTAAFKGCTSMTAVGFYSKGGKVSNECFSGCSALKDVVLGEDVTAIGNYAFAGCASLKYIELSKNINSISETSFANTNVTFGVYYGSYAYDYARSNSVPYILLDGVKLGDVNGDNVVNINDVTVIQSHLAEMKKLEGVFLYAADTNRNGEVKIDDATTLQMFLAEYELNYPIGEVLTQ